MTRLQKYIGLDKKLKYVFLFLVTERANQARDYILKKDLTGFDG